MMNSMSSALHSASSPACRALPGEGSQVQPKAPLLQILRVAGAQEEIFTLKEVMHYLGQYIIVKELYDKQRQHIVHCQDDPLGELLEVESFSVKSPSPVYEMLKRNLLILNGSAQFIVSNSSLQYMQGTMGRSYMCSVEEVLPVVSTFSLNTFDLQVQPFGIHDNQFGPVDMCRMQKDNMLVPIIVGACLAGLILIVLVAYLIGRKRSHAGYQTI